MDGILLVDKPEHWTSFDVVAKVRGLLKRSGQQKPKVGHSGTLDPLASGLLVLLVGSYTKRAQEFTKLDKIYQTTIILGATSTTGDEEGEKTVVSDKKPSRSDVEIALERFVGAIEQRPPAYSAIKVNGVRAYDLSRKGQSVELSPRTVTIHQLTLEDYSYPKLKIETRVSSGTYIRSLAEDIGKELGTGAYVSSLRRLQVGPFSLREAIMINELTTEQIYQSLQSVKEA